MQAAIRALIDSYCTTLSEQIAEATGHVDNLNHNCTDHQTTLNRLLDIVHQITGLSGSMGYPEISVHSAPLEKHIRGLDSAGTYPDNGELTRLFELFQPVKRLADRVTPEMSALYNADFSRIAAQDEDPTSGAKTHASK